MTDLLVGAIKVSALLSLGLLAAMLLLKRQSAALRHWVLATTIACGLALPAVSGIAPHWRGALPWPRSPSMDPLNAAAGQGRALDTASAGAVVVQPTAPMSSAVEAGRGRIEIDAIAWTVWLLGVAVSILVLITGLARLHWLAARAHVTEHPLWRQIGEQLRLDYGLRTPVRLLQSEHPALLVTWGWRTPTILLPAHAPQWSAERIRVVLAHELAHVARGDWAAQLAAEALRAFYWFNPLVWLACRRLRLESECACDDAVLAQGIAAPDYAAHLLALARSLQALRHPSLPAPAMARPSSLEGRVRAMLNHAVNRRAPSSSARAVCVAALLAATIAVAGLQGQAPFFGLTGTAFDPSGRVLPNTRLVLTNTRDQAKFEVRTDAAGRYAFAGLPGADYGLEASLPGFATLHEPVRIEGPAERDLHLRVGTLQETITVDDAPERAPAVDPVAAQKREDARRRATELAARDTLGCAAGATPGVVGGKIVPPKKLVHVTPVFPEGVRTTTTRGSVTMTAVIGTDGLVRDVQDVQGPHPDLEAAAADAVRQWQFSTTFLNCEPIEVQMVVTTSFLTR